jgi:hypothetical protein
MQTQNDISSEPLQVTPVKNSQFYLEMAKASTGDQGINSNEIQHFDSVDCSPDLRNQSNLDEDYIPDH